MFRRPFPLGKKREILSGGCGGSGGNSTRPKGSLFFSAAYATFYDTSRKPIFSFFWW